MHRPISVLLLLLTTTTLQAATYKCPETKAEFDCFNSKLTGRLIEFTDHYGADRRIWSPALCQKRNLLVYVPPGYTTTRQYPILIWFHGLFQDECGFFDAIGDFDQRMVDGRLPPMIIAMPDHTIKGKLGLRNNGSWLINSQAGRFEDYFIQDVWGFLKSNFPIRPERELHCLAGPSIGGFEAVDLGIKYRNEFHLAIGVIPILNWRYADCHGNYRTKFDPNCTGYIEQYRPFGLLAFYNRVPVFQRLIFKPIFTREETVRRASEENPVEMLDRLDLKPGELKMWLGSVTDDEMNANTQTDSFLYVARRRGLCPDITYIKIEGKHDLASGLKMIDPAAKWLNERLIGFDPKLQEKKP